MSPVHADYGCKRLEPGALISVMPPRHARVRDV